MEDSVRSSGVVLKQKTSSGCLIIRKKDHKMGIKRPRMVDMLDAITKKSAHNDSGRNMNLFDLNEYGDDTANVATDCREEFGSGTMRSVMVDHYMDCSSSKRMTGNDYGFKKRKFDLVEDKQVHMPIPSREPIRLQGKNGVLKVMVNNKKKIDIASLRKVYDHVETDNRNGSWSKDVDKNNLQVRPFFCSVSKQPEKPPLSTKTEKIQLKPQKVMLGKSIDPAVSEKDGTDTQLKLAPPSLPPARSAATQMIKEESRPLASEDVTPAKSKDGKVKRGGSTEKQQLREKIRAMLLEAGWTIDYRPRKNRVYLDAVYINPSGTAYWSIIKAYEAFQKHKPVGGSRSFVPIPDDSINKLTRQTRKKIEKEMKMKLKDDGKRRDPNSTSVGESLFGSDGDQHEERLSRNINKQGMVLRGKLYVTDEESGDNSSENSLKVGRFEQDMAGKSSSGVASDQMHERKSKIIGRSTLLVRHSDKGKNSDGDGYVPYTGKRTLLSWLIDTGTLKVNQKVQYVNCRRTRVKLEGWIAQDGVHCGCCSKIISVSKFELHAGSKLRQPFLNIVLESGASLLECLVAALNQQKESDRHDFYSVDIDGDSPEDDVCGICADGGDLICCDGCPSTFHQTCLGIQMLPPGDWHCPNCTCKFCGAASRSPAEDNERTANELLSCCLCEKPYHKACSAEANALAIADNPSASFCGWKCQEVYNHLQNILGVKHELGAGFSWSLIRRTDLGSDISHRSFTQRVECNSKLAVALAVMDECFLPFIDRRSGINIIHNVLYNSGSNFSRLNFRGFHTAILEKGDEIVSAASIRIRGTQLAEMPFIGTRNIYRRQGMCRRLLSVIEMVLCNLKVAKLVVPAICEHRHSWTKVFGFGELEESTKQEMRSINMLVFPGTDMLQKRLLKQDIQEACQLQHTHPQSPALSEKSNQDSSIRKDGHLSDVACVNVVEKPDDKVGSMDSGSPAYSVHLSVRSTVKTQGGYCRSDIQISSKEEEENFAEPSTELILSSLSGARNDTPDTKDAALGPAKIDVNSGIEQISQKVENTNSQPPFSGSVVNSLVEDSSGSRLAEKQIEDASDNFNNRKDICLVSVDNCFPEKKSVIDIV